MRPAPPTEEQVLGLATYLTDAPGIGGRLRTEVEDFRVVELGPGPPAGEGRFAAARIELRSWETNRFAAKAAREIGIKPGQVGFGGMKDKRAVTEQWFSFQCAPDRVHAIERLEDVRIVEGPYQARDRYYPGAHTGNRFVLRVRGHHADAATVDATTAAIQAAGGVPHYFGPQRFGSGVRPVTPLMGQALVAGDLEEAVRLYVGHPYDREREDVREARRIYEETRDPAAALEAYPQHLDLERGILQRLARRPGEWRHALQALPHNLLTLFIHSWQSLLYNHILSARLDAGLGLRTANLGDRVMAIRDDGLQTVPVTAANQARVQSELDKGRATLTAPLIGLTVPLAEGEPGAIEQQVLDRFAIDRRAFRVRELPELASDGRRRGILQGVWDLGVDWVEGDPVVSFSLGKGSYATVVMREYLKAGLEAY